MGMQHSAIQCAYQETKAIKAMACPNPQPHCSTPTHHDGTLVSSPHRRQQRQEGNRSLAAPHITLRVGPVGEGSANTRTDGMQHRCTTGHSLAHNRPAASWHATMHLHPVPIQLNSQTC